MRTQPWNCNLPQNRARSEDEMREHLLLCRTVTENGCWEWTGATSPRGYGKIKWRKFGDLRVHRVAAMLWLGIALDDPRLACHKCDNPKCFNPEHLFMGTSSDNQVDCVRKGRNARTQKTHCQNGHEFNSENTHVDARGARRCRACHRIEALRSYRRRVGQ